jgi:PAS domain S-box-containing protein
VAPTYHILYVDDELALLEIGKLFLERSGQFSIDVITSAPAALNLLNTESFDAIISDYQMPEMDGIAFLKIIRKTYPELPFILFTGRGREDVVIEAINNGSDSYLQKGGDPRAQFAELEHRILIAIERRQAVRALRESEKKYRLLLEGLQDSIIVHRNTRILYLNPACEKVLGYSRDALLGQSIMHLVPPEFQELVTIAVRKRMAAETFEPYELDLIRGDGTRISVLMSGTLIEFEGAPASVNLITDITARKEIEKTLRESEEKYRSVLENIQDIYYRSDAAGNLGLASPSAAHLFGYESVSELVGKNIAQSFYYYPEERAKLLADLSREGSVTDYEVTVKKRDGTPVIVSTSSHKYYDSSGNFLGVEGIFRDITRQKQTENALRESEGRFAAFMDNLPVTAFIKDEQSTNLYVNRHMVEVFGEQEWIGKSVYEQFPKEAADKMIADDQQTIREGYRRNTEYLIDKNGDKKIFETHKFRIDRGNKPPFIGGFAVDITEQKLREQKQQENEQRLISIYNTVEDSIFQLAVEDRGQYRFTSVNAAFSRTTGVPPEQVIGRTVNEIITEPSLSLVLEKYRQAVEKKVIVRWEETSDYPTGRLTGEVCIAPIFDKAGICTHLIGSVHDITACRRAEEALRLINQTRS